MQKPDALSPQIAKNSVYTCNVAAWTPENDVWQDRGTDNRKRRGDSLNCLHHQSGAADRGKNGYLPADEVGRQSRQSIVLRKIPCAGLDGLRPSPQMGIAECPWVGPRALRGKRHKTPPACSCPLEIRPFLLLNARNRDIV
jgi:hypothetical protein